MTTPSDATTRSALVVGVLVAAGALTGCSATSGADARTTPSPNVSAAATAVDPTADGPYGPCPTCAR